MINERAGNVLTSDASVLRRWRENFEVLIIDRNERERRVEEEEEEEETVKRQVRKIIKDEVRNTLKRMKNGEAVGPDDILIVSWKCLEKAVEFRMRPFKMILESEQLLSLHEFYQETLSLCVHVKQEYYPIILQMRSYPCNFTPLRCCLNLTKSLFKLETELG